MHYSKKNKFISSTYRVQLTPDCSFESLAKYAGYLSKLGISHIYASPIFQSSKGSRHGYDVVDHCKIDSELGGKKKFYRLINKLKSKNLGWIQDVVPNHMAYDYDNKYLAEVLEHGRKSRYYHLFDINWLHPYKYIKKRLLAPFLGRLYGNCLENGEIKLGFDRYGFFVSYFNQKFKIKIDSYAKILNCDKDYLLKSGPGGFSNAEKLNQIIERFEKYKSVKKNAVNFAEKIKRDLWFLYLQTKPVKNYIDYLVKVYNGKKGDPTSFDLLDKLLAEQYFRLTYWKVATEEINYRRFFAINRLIALNVHYDDVFDYIHSLLFELIRDGKIDGIRIDHIDGLYDPRKYLAKIKTRFPNLYITVEKILSQKETLPDWKIDGTTGYDFLYYVNNLLCKKKNAKKIGRIYSSFIKFDVPYDELIIAKKRLVIAKHLGGDIDNLVRMLKNFLSRDRHGTDFTANGLKRAITEVMVRFPVYRTYICEEEKSQNDEIYIKETIKKAVSDNIDLINELKFIESILLIDLGESATQKQIRQCSHFVMKFQQYTTVTMAKGLEDTALYIFNRLVSLNEVGGDPSVFGLETREFHKFNARRAKNTPLSLNTTSTHDTKRGEDTRARINILSEIPDQWNKSLKKWSKLNKNKKKIIGHYEIPTRNEEYFLYQTMLGSLPFNYKNNWHNFADRIKRYIIKASREAKVFTGWIAPDDEYESALVKFIEDILKFGKDNEFLADFIKFQNKIADLAVFNGISQVLLKITSPGVADFYQGTEFWDLTLVDPDNRGKVDFEKRAKALKYIRNRINEKPKLIKELLTNTQDGKIKLFSMYLSLKARNENPNIFTYGKYIPVACGGECKNNIIAFKRQYKGKKIIVVATRFLANLVTKTSSLPTGRKIWQNTFLKLSGKDCGIYFRDVFTDRIIETRQKCYINDVLKNFPVALMVQEQKNRR